MKSSRYLHNLAALPLSLLPLLSLLFASCEKEIDFTYHDIPRQQVIEGLLTQEGVSVRLTKTVPTDEPFTGATVTDATVSIRDLDTDKLHTLLPGEDGSFTLGGLTGETGHTYELTVTIGDESYRSTSRMLPRVEIMSAEFNWIKMPYDDVAVLKVTFTQDTDPQTQYWLRVYRNGQPYQWQAIESRNAVDGLVTGMMMTSRRDITEEDDDEVLKEGDIVDIEVLPVSRTMGDYLNSLNNGDYNGNIMFTGSYSLGYFLAAPLSATTLTYHPGQIPYAE